MLVKYVREGSRMVGCVVAIGAGQVGWSICHPSKNKFNKDLAVEIASGRAEKGSSTELPKYRSIWVWEKDYNTGESVDLSKVQLSAVLNNEITRMIDRSYKFFK